MRVIRLCASWRAGRDALAISGGLVLVVALLGIYGTHKQSRMILISCAVTALVMVQMVNSQQVSAFVVDRA